MNKLGQVGIFLGIMLFIAALWIGAITAKPVKDIIDVQRTSLNCNSDTLTTGGILACLATDIILPLYILTLIGAAGGAIFTAAKAGT